jgi:hypothetical protein
MQEILYLNLPFGSRCKSACITVSLKQLGLKSIDLDYHRSGRKDEYGNVFRFRGKVKDTHDAQLGRWAWDVFLISGP